MNRVGIFQIQMEIVIYNAISVGLVGMETEQQRHVLNVDRDIIQMEEQIVVVLVVDLERIQVEVDGLDAVVALLVIIQMEEQIVVVMDVDQEHIHREVRTQVVIYVGKEHIHQMEVMIVVK